MKYKLWIETWLELYVKPTCKIRSYEKYEQTVRIHIIPALGEYEMMELTAVCLQRFIVNLTHNGNVNSGKGLAANTVNGVISILQRSLQVAVNTEQLTKQYADLIVRPKTAEKKVECFSIKEQREIEKYVLDNYEKKPKLFGILLCLYTGLRIGELLALEWSDLDFEHNQLSVCKTAYSVKGKNGECELVIDSPKTANSTRIIPIPKQLATYCKQLKKWSKSLYIIAQNNKPVCVRSYQRTFELLLRKLKIAHHGFHALRHTFATRALECGMDVKTLSEILGHKNTSITLNRYAHSLMEHKTEMMNRLGKQLFIDNE